MATARTRETAEAVCSALHRLDWEHQGDTDAGQVSWFVRGEAPHLVRVRVVRRHQHVVLVLEWPQLGAGQQLHRGFQELTIDCHEPDQVVRDAAQAAVRRCLVVLRDVYAGVGAASDEAVWEAPNRVHWVPPATRAYHADP